ncbi:hypothetical protein D5086_011066 [Populus alba]|uniref:Uncharacterized protein n=1 Tax=Populus alba TaxID=43335 RepID=A0ACC4CCK0_POPAL
MLIQMIRADVWGRGIGKSSARMSFDLIRNCFELGRYRVESQRRSAFVGVSEEISSGAVDICDVIAAGQLQQYVLGRSLGKRQFLRPKLGKNGLYVFLLTRDFQLTIVEDLSGLLSSPLLWNLNVFLLRYQFLHQLSML